MKIPVAPESTRVMVSTFRGLYTRPPFPGGFLRNPRNGRNGLGILHSANVIEIPCVSPGLFLVHFCSIPSPIRNAQKCTRNVPFHSGLFHCYII